MIRYRKLPTPILLVLLLHSLYLDVSLTGYHRIKNCLLIFLTGYIRYAYLYIILSCPGHVIFNYCH